MHVNRAPNFGRNANCRFQCLRVRSRTSKGEINRQRERESEMDKSSYKSSRRWRPKGESVSSFACCLWPGACWMESEDAPLPGRHTTSGQQIFSGCGAALCNCCSLSISELFTSTLWATLDFTGCPSRSHANISHKHFCSHYAGTQNVHTIFFLFSLVQVGHCLCHWSLMMVCFFFTHYFHSFVKRKQRNWRKKRWSSIVYFPFVCILSILPFLCRGISVFGAQHCVQCTHFK